MYLDPTVQEEKIERREGKRVDTSSAKEMEGRIGVGVAQARRQMDLALSLREHESDWMAVYS